MVHVEGGNGHVLRWRSETLPFWPQSTVWSGQIRLTSSDRPDSRPGAWDATFVAFETQEPSSLSALQRQASIVAREGTLPISAVLCQSLPYSATHRHYAGLDEDALGHRVYRAQHASELARAQQVHRLVVVERVVGGEQPVVGRFGP